MADSTPDEQPPAKLQVGHQKDGAVEENRMEINCNGHSCSPEDKDSSETSRTKQSEEEREDQQNANKQENSAETPVAPCNKEEHETRDASPGELDPTLQQLPASLNSDAAVEPNDGEKEEKKTEEMDTQGENKKESDEEDSQSG